jgi:hypothetical protein
MLSVIRGFMLLTKVHTVRRTSEMFGLSNSDYDRWLHGFVDAFARLDALETADLRGSRNFVLEMARRFDGHR